MNRPDALPQPRCLAAMLLGVGAVRCYGWYAAEFSLRGMAAKGLGALAIIILLGVVWDLAGRRMILAPVLLWWAFEETTTAVCAALYVSDPWPVPAGVAVCSARAGINIDALGVLILGLLARWSAHFLCCDQSSKGDR